MVSRILNTLYMSITIREGYNDKTAYEFFIQNCQHEYNETNQGSTSFVFKCSLNSSVLSPYLRYGDPAQPVNIILTKILILARYVTHPSFSLLQGDEEREIYVTPISGFEREIGIQREITSKTVRYGKLCPDILYSRNCSDENEFKFKIPPILNGMLKSEILGDVQHRVHHIDGYGIIAMEFAENYINISKLIGGVSLEKKKMILNVAAFLIIKLFIITGYSQGDFSFNNILITGRLLTEELTIEELSEHALFIDFGKALKIPILKSLENPTDDIERDKEMKKQNREIELSNMIGYFHAGEYKKLLILICFQGNTDYKDLVTRNNYGSHEQYSWASGFCPPTPATRATFNVYKSRYIESIKNRDFSYNIFNLLLCEEPDESLCQVDEGTVIQLNEHFDETIDILFSQIKGEILDSDFVKSVAQITNIPPGDIDTTQPGDIDTTRPGDIDTTQPGSIDTMQPGSIDTMQPGSIDTTQPGSIDIAGGKTKKRYGNNNKHKCRSKHKRHSKDKCRSKHKRHSKDKCRSKRGRRYSRIIRRI